MGEKNAVTILSGGMDSATLAFFMQEHGWAQTFLSFNYGQRHVKELLSAAAIARIFDAPHHVIDMSGLGTVLSSALTDQTREVPEGHYEQSNMSQTVVPNRNAIMLSIAWGVACSVNASVVTFGAHAGDHLIYPDCRMDFVNELDNALRMGTSDMRDPDLHIIAPFILKSKGGIVKEGLRLKVPYELTWTCYKGGAVACGRCGCCVERLQAFAENNTEDPLPYEDREYWQSALEEYALRKSSQG